MLQIERLAFVAFPVTDLNRSREFYVDIFGASVLNQSSDWAQLALGGISARAYLHQGEYRRQHSGLQFTVPNVDRAHQELSAVKS